MCYRYSCYQFYIQLRIVININMDRLGIYGYLAGCTAAATLQPLENIKMVMLVPPKQVQFTKNFITNVGISAKYLYRDDGFRAFYRGLIPNVLRTGFSSSIYFSFLRFGQKISKRFDSTISTQLGSFVSSLSARILSVLSSNPLSVLQTRYEYAGHERWSGGIIRNLIKIYKVEGIKGFWKGGLTTCYKEGFFAGLYYMLYQEGKLMGINAFVSGMLAGMISTSLTHPFQIVRAEIQSFILTQNQLGGGSIARQLKTLVSNGQAFRGLAPRVIKKPLTNTLAFLMFQKMEKNGQKQ